SRVVSFAPTDSLERLISTDPPGGIGGPGLVGCKERALGRVPARYRNRAGKRLAAVLARQRRSKEAIVGSGRRRVGRGGPMSRKILVFAVLLVTVLGVFGWVGAGTSGAAQA